MFLIAFGTIAVLMFAARSCHRRARPTYVGLPDGASCPPNDGFFDEPPDRMDCVVPYDGVYRCNYNTHRNEVTCARLGGLR